MPDSTTDALPAPGAPDGGACAQARGQQIALVDDDRNILTSVSIALQAEGFAVRLYSDGDSALKALIENPPDLVVLDIKMPRMDGMEVLRRLREKVQVPVIFLTSKDTEIDEALGLAMGADDWSPRRSLALGALLGLALIIDDAARRLIASVRSRREPPEDVAAADRPVTDQVAVDPVRVPVPD